MSPMEEVLFRSWLKAHQLHGVDNPEQFKPVFQQTGGQIHPPGMLQPAPEGSGSDPMAEHMKLLQEQEKQNTERVKAQSAQAKHHLEMQKHQMGMEKARMDLQKQQQQMQLAHHNMQMQQQQHQMAMQAGQQQQQMAQHKMAAANQAAQQKQQQSLQDVLTQRAMAANGGHQAL